jgi:Leucine-rich repeat (LRR) protein
MKKAWILVVVGLLVVAVYFLGGRNKVDDSGILKDSLQSNGLNVPVDYSGQGLTSFPQDVLKQTDTTILDLSNNKLTGSLPAEIKNLTELRELDVSNNRMTGIPAEIGQLSKLMILDYSYNGITGIPMELGNLTQLKLLDLRGNEISKQDLARIKPFLKDTTIKL